MSKLNSKRILAIAAALAVAAGGSAAIAASKGSSASPSGFFDSVAKHLGISSTKLRDATKAAAIDQVDAALKEGTITKAQADELKARIKASDFPLLGFPRFGAPFFGGMHRGGPFGHHLSAAAKYLGLTEDQLLEKLRSGQSLADVAKAQDKSVDGLKQAILADAKTRLDKAVSDGMLTRAQADRMLDRLRSHVDDLVNGSFRGPGERGEFRFRNGPPPDLWGAAA